MSLRRLCFLLLLSPLLLTGCGKKASVEKESAPFVVGMEMTYPPFEMRDANNRPDGISVRMAEDLAAWLGRSLEFRDVEWDGLIPALQSGKIDIIISSMTRTPEREKMIAFSDGYVTNGICLLVGINSTIQSVEDLKQGTRKMAVKLGTTGHQWARTNLPNVSLIILDDAGTCALEVAQGKADAFLYDQISIYQFWRKYDKQTRPILQPIRQETWAIGLRKGDEALREKINAFLADYREKGRFNDLANRYMSEEKATFEKMGVPFIFH